jgi:aryl-alcohol dehydrogenase-like predicted oxidoreductase
MDHNESGRTDRRTFLQAGALATASALAAGPGRAAQEAAPQSSELPRRPLGKTGVDVTILDIGTGRGRDVDRLLRYAFARGVRSYDTSETYHSEVAFKRWFEQDATVRKQIFLVTKDAPKVPAQIPGMLDKRLAALGTDYVDLFFIHSFGDNHTLDEAIAMVKSKELKEASEAARRSGKARFVGISTHHKDRAQLIEAAAEGGIVDAIMLQYRPWLDKDSPLNKAIDAAHKRGIGLISMKQIAGNYLGDKPQGNISGSSRRSRACCTRSGPTSASVRSAPRCATPTRSARTPTPPCDSSRSRRPTSAGSATRPSRTAPCSAPTATAVAPSPRARTPSSAT